MILPLSTPYTDSVPSNSSSLEPQTLMPSGKYLKHCEQANRQNFYLE